VRAAPRPFLLACVAALGLSSAAAAQSVTARVGGDLTGLPNSTVTVPITVDMSASGGAKLGSYTARLSWDTLALSYCAYCSTDSLRGNFPAPQINTDSVSKGVLRLTAISPLGVDGLVTVAQLPFSTGVDTLSTPLQLSFSEMSAAGTFTSLLPLLTVTGATYCPASGRWGDLDGDGVAGSRDALMVLSSVVGIPFGGQVNATLGDVDADGQVTSRDALIILSYAVGIPVTGQRVLLLAPGSSCGTGSARQLAVFPAAASLVVNQTLQLTVQAVDTAGRAVSGAAASWSSSDYGIAGVDATGIVTPRSPGTATITAAFGPGVQASATITVLARRPNWYVSLQATGAPVELGDSAHPFEHPTQAYALASEGDTIRVAPGTYLFSTDGQLNAGVVILGGTPGDTTTRPTFLDESNAYTALWLEGGARTLVRNVTFRNFYEAVDLDGARSLALEDVDILMPAGSYGYGVYSCVNTTVDSVRVERTAFLGDSATQAGYAMYYGGCGLTKVTEVRDSRIRFWGTGLELSEADSLDVVGSEISDNDGYGIYLGVGDPVYPALHVARSRLERNSGATIYGYDYRRVVVDSSVLRSTENTVFDIEGTNSAQTMELYMRGDSIFIEGNANDEDWLYVYDADTVSMDRSVVRLPADTADFYSYGEVYGDNASVTNTHFLDFGSSGSYAFYFSGRQFFADSVTMTGCLIAGCDQATGLDVYTSGSNASATIRRSQFSQIQEPIYIEASEGPATVQNVAVDSADYGIEIYRVDRAAALDNVLTRIWSGSGILLGSEYEGPAPAGVAVARDSVTCSSSGSGSDIYVSGRRLTARDNFVQGCYFGIQTYGLQTGSVLLHNTVRGSPWGIFVEQHDTVAVRIDSNAVSTSNTVAVTVWAGRGLVTGNNIQNNPGDGLYLTSNSGYLHQVHGNALAGNALYALLSLNDSVDATNNWWGSAAGPGGGDYSGRIATSPFLTSLPGGLPSLAPPALLASRAGAAAPQPQPQAPSRARATRPAHAAGAPRRLTPAVVPPPGASPQRIARTLQIEQRRAAREAEDAARREQHEAQVKAQRERAHTPRSSSLRTQQ